MAAALDQHAAWLARSLGRTHYLPMSREDAIALAQAGTVLEKYKGTHLFREGDRADACFIVREGEVELYRACGEGKSVVARLGPSSVVGDIAMFSDRPYLSSARVMTGTQVLRLERDRVVPLLLERPLLAMRWLVNGLAQLEATQQRVIRLMNRTVLEKVAGLLLDEQDTFGEVHLSQAAIAELLGASRQSVNEALARLRANGGVATSYRRITLLDVDVLAAAS
ncbi:MAG: Crp/Fnr family transcriptional regulator [Actinomycetota bacterium]|nr:Crp/Fnr family transcriptional regulator [Actinomycetota bacterium]